MVKKHPKTNMLNPRKQGLKEKGKNINANNLINSLVAGSSQATSLLQVGA